MVRVMVKMVGMVATTMTAAAAVATMRMEVHCQKPW
jgi:septal ring-binding cell division protein DamX